MERGERINLDVLTALLLQQLEKWPYGQGESNLGACQEHLSTRTVNCLRIN